MKPRHQLIFSVLAFSAIFRPSSGQLNFNLPSIFSRLSKTSQNVVAVPKQDPVVPDPVLVPVPTITTPACTDNETHFELITGGSFRIFWNVSRTVFSRGGFWTLDIRSDFSLKASMHQFIHKTSALFIKGFITDGLDSNRFELPRNFIYSQLNQLHHLTFELDIVKMLYFKSLLVLFELLSIFKDLRTYHRVDIERRRAQPHSNPWLISYEACDLPLSPRAVKRRLLQRSQQKISLWI